MRSTTRAVLVALAVVTIAGWAVAQAAQPQGAQQPYRQPAGTHEEMRPAPGQMQGQMQYQPILDSADKLIGAQIVNDQGQKLGNLEDIVLEPGLNYVAYAAMSHKSKNFAIPWDVLQLSADQKNLVLNIPEQAFDQAQGFDKNRWPDRADQRWRTQAMAGAPMGQQPMTHEQMGQPPSSEQSWREQQYKEQQQWRQQEGGQPQAMNEQQRSNAQVYGRPAPQSREWQTAPESQSQTWGQTPQTQSGDRHAWYSSGKEGFEFRRVSKLLGVNVHTFATQEKIGDLKDIILDVPQGLVAYGIVSVKNGNAPVPWSAIEIRPMDKVALVDADVNTLNQAAFKGDVLAELSNPQYAQNLYTQFNREPYWEVLGFVGGPQSEHMQPMTHPMQPGTQPGGQEPLKQYFNPQQITVISGTIQSIGTFEDPQLGTGERLRITTDDGQTVSVLSGPRQFLEQQGLTLQRNEQVQIRGSFANINGRTVFIASDLRTQQAEVQLRDQQGNPLWSSMGMQGGQQHPQRMQSQQPQQQGQQPLQQGQPQTY